MSKLFYNHEVLEVNATDKLRSALNVINGNIELLSNINIGDFNDDGSIALSIDELTDSKNRLNDILNAIEGINSDLDSLMYNYEVRALKLPESTLKRRNNRL